MTHEAGKGDTQRPTNHDKFSSNYDNIFKKQRQHTVCTRCGKEFWLRADDVHIHTCTPKVNDA